MEQIWLSLSHNKYIFKKKSFEKPKMIMKTVERQHMVSYGISIDLHNMCHGETAGSRK